MVRYPQDERDFEIPTHISDFGRPNTDLKITPHCDMNTKWGELLNRLFIVMKDTKYETQAIRKLRGHVKESGGIENEDGEDDSAGPADLHDVQDDTPANKVRCYQCGHHFDLSERGCQICSGGTPTDHRRRRRELVRCRACRRRVDRLLLNFRSH